MLKKLTLCGLFIIIYIISSVSLCQAQIVEEGRLQTSLTPEPFLFSESYYSQEASDEFKKKWMLIETELNNSQDEWVGDYKAGMDTAFVSLRVSRNNGYVLAYVSVCAHSLVWKMDYGKVAEFSHSILQLSSTLDQTLIKAQPRYMENSPFFSGTYVPVKWGERHYIVPKENIADFCVQKDAFIGESLYFIKQTDWEKLAYGELILPAEYKDLLKEHVEANVIGIVGERIVKHLKEHSNPNFYQVTTTVKLDVGRNQNIPKELSLYLFAYIGDKAKVIDVQETTCTATIVQEIELTSLDLNKCEGEECFLVKVGDKFFTNTQKDEVQQNQEENNN